MWISKNRNWLQVFRTSIDSCFAGPTLFLLVSGTGPAGYFEDWIYGEIILGETISSNSMDTRLVAFSNEHKHS